MKLRCVTGKDIATAGVIGFDHVIGRGSRHGFVCHAIAMEEVAEIKLGCCSALHAHFATVEIKSRVGVSGAGRHEALTVVEVTAANSNPRSTSRDIVHVEFRGQNVNFARLQSGKAVVCRQWHEFYFVGVIKNCGGESAAKVNVESGPLRVCRLR